MKPKINISPSFRFHEHEDAVLFCNVTGYPRSVIKWTRLGKDLPGNVTYRNEKSELVLRSVEHYDTGTYKCSAKNDAGIAADTTTLWIEKGKRIHSGSISNIVVMPVKCRQCFQPGFQV